MDGNRKLFPAHGGAGIVRISALSWAVFLHSLRPGNWPVTVRDVLYRQIYFTGIQALPLTAGIALLVGLSVVGQAEIFFTQLGQKSLLGPILVSIVVTNLAPMLVNFIIIGRSSTAIATELSNMTISGETQLLEALGIDPFTYLVIPRVIAVVFSVLSLTAVFIACSIASGYLFALYLSPSFLPPLRFLESIASGMSVYSFLSLFAKTLIPALLTGIICCLEGIGVNRSITEVPQAVTRAVVKSVAFLFLISAVASVLLGV